LDNITHSLTGWALGQAGLKTKTRKGLAALILGANMPDIDVFFGWVPWEPLAIHRGFTHGILGVLVMPPILFGLLLLLDRWQADRGEKFKSGLPMRPWWLLALCYLGAATHPSLDLLTTYSVQLFSPFSSRWWHADGLFIIDIWLWLLLGLSIFWSKRREKSGLEWRRPVRVAIAVALAYISLNLVISDRAIAAVRSNNPRAQAIFASPPPAYFWRRRVVWREGACYRWAVFDPFGGMAPAGACQPTNMDDPLVRRALAEYPSLRSFMRWSILPQAEIVRRRCTVRIAISDARYGDRRNSRLGRDIVMPTGAPNC
jgi:inner membrane protein